jgi:hypothetical protein
MEEVKKTEQTENIKKRVNNIFSILTKRKGKKSYPKNRQGMRAAMHDSGTLKGHSRRSAARAKVHKPTPLELEDWADWKAEQRAKKEATHAG